MSDKFIDASEMVGYCNECGAEYRGLAVMTHGLCSECERPVDLSTVDDPGAYRNVAEALDGVDSHLHRRIIEFLWVQNEAVSGSAIARGVHAKKVSTLEALKQLEDAGRASRQRDGSGWAGVAWPKSTVPIRTRSMRMLRGDVRLHRSGEQYAISTNAETERDFLDGVASALAALDSSASELARWLPLIVDVSAKMRGYKADVIEKRLIIAGAWLPDDSAAVVSSAKVDEETAIAP